MKANNFMLNKISAVAISLAVLGLSDLSRAESSGGYLCISDQSIGFQRRPNGKWEKFSVSPLYKYLVLRPSSDELVSFRRDEWIVKVVDPKHSVPLFTCANDFDSYGAERLFCDGFGAFTMSKKTMRFQRTYDDGYVTDEGSSGIELGTCKELAK